MLKIKEQTYLINLTQNDAEPWFFKSFPGVAKLQESNLDE